MAPADPLPADSAFAESLRAWRLRRGYTQETLAKAIEFDWSDIADVENARHPPAESLATRAEGFLQAGGDLLRRFPEECLGPDERDRIHYLKAVGVTAVVVEEFASLRLTERWCHCRVERVILNIGDTPMTRFTAYVDVNRFPKDHLEARRFYARNPLTWRELHFHASISLAPGQTLTCRLIHDRDSFKQVTVAFEADSALLPLYPGKNAKLTYWYCVPTPKWGPFFQREIRMPTRRLRVVLDLPERTKPVFGEFTSLTTEIPAQLDLSGVRKDGSVAFEWTSLDPPLQSVFRFSWG